MLDDAQYFVMTFIRGPVCRGQVAVDVIEDRFFVSFLDPDHDLSITDPDLPGARRCRSSSCPRSTRARSCPASSTSRSRSKQRKYLDERDGVYAAADPKKLGPTLDWIWDGDGRNTNAQLTVFRNYDNATVVRGFVGATPKTAWVMDYPIFERIYYDLVAGFNVYGNVVHQVSTRLYMDHLRMQSENLFLSFLPADKRESLRASWYVDATHTHRLPRTSTSCTAWTSGRRSGTPPPTRWRSSSRRSWRVPGYVAGTARPRHGERARRRDPAAPARWR